MTMTIEQAARSEQAAERNRSQAEAVWRRAWWQTTLALGVPDSAGEVTIALDIAERILGQSRSWLASRRRTGRAFSTLPRGQVDALPPRLAIAYTEAHGNPDKAVAVLRDAESRGLSLRDFAAAMGTQPKSWLREGEQAARPITAEQLTGRPPSEQAVLIRTALANPVVAGKVFNDPTPLPRLPDHGPRARPGLPAAPDYHPHRPAAEPVPDLGKPDVLALLESVRDGVVQAFKLSVLRNLAGDADVLAAVESLQRETGYLHRYASGQAADDAISKILADG
jgi:hypothetical protein